MKKIITASLVAMMAVTAANAEIASVEYLEGKTGDISTLTTTAKSNLTAAVNELNTGVQAAATKTALEQGLATKQDTIGDLATIRSGAAAGATALQQDAIAADGATVADADLDKVAPSIFRMENAIANSKSEISDDLTDITESLDDLAQADTDNLQAAKTYADGVAATAKSEAIAASDSKGSAAQALTDAKAYADQAEADAITAAGTAADGKIATALEDYSTTTEMNQAIATATTDMATTGNVATAKSEAIAAAAEAAEIYIDADELAASQSSQDTTLKAYADGKVQDLQGTLTSLATFPTACAQGTSDCALVIRSGTMQWEKVSY
ncbi:MAG: hypothetical protein E7011_03725 [Alphaproteobacteria bacterium]|nr:hypothetical protein [Alphaproteobacteria bacterium]